MKIITYTLLFVTVFIASVSINKNNDKKNILEKSSLCMSNAEFSESYNKYLKSGEEKKTSHYKKMVANCEPLSAYHNSLEAKQSGINIKIDNFHSFIMSLAFAFSSMVIAPILMFKKDIPKKIYNKLAQAKEK